MSDSTLFNITSERYGKEYKDHLLRQYELYIKSVEKVSDRRQAANSFFLTLNTALVSVIGISSQVSTASQILWWKVPVALSGIVVTVVWHFLIRSYKQLNTGKFSVIHQAENKLPLSLYQYEWHILGNGEDVDRYFPFSHIEQTVPWIFAVLYALIIILLFVFRE